MIARFQHGAMGTANTALYALEPPYGPHAYALAVSLEILGTEHCYVFPANGDGQVTSDLTLAECTDTLNHEILLACLGYEPTHDVL